MTGDESLINQLKLGVDFLQSGHLDKAENTFNEILAGIKDEPNALNYLGLISQRRGNLREAYELIQKSLKSDDSNYIAYSNLGKILLQAGKPREAAICFEESIIRKVMNSNISIAKRPTIH